MSDSVPALPTRPVFIAPVERAPIYEPEPERWKSALILSVLLHLAVGAGFFLGLRSLRPPEPTTLSTAMAIEIMPMPAAPVAPAHETPPQPDKPVPTPVNKVAKLDLPPIPNIPNVKAEVTIPQKEAQPSTKAPPPPPPAAQAAPARTAAAPVRNTPTQGVSTIQQSYDGQIVARLERRKRYPSNAMRQHMEDVVYLHMVIDRTGHIVSSDIVRSKRLPLLDGAVRDLVKRVDPLPPMPKGLPGDTYSVTVPINFFINRGR